MITSINNDKIKELIKLKQINQIKKHKKYIVDGLHLVKEAIKNNNVIEIFVVDGFDKNIDFMNKSINITYITEKVANTISDTINNQGIFALCRIENKAFDINQYHHILILDRIQDPGNLGTLIRSADAFNFDCVLLSKGTTHMYSQKVIRSMQGSHFHIDCFDNIDIKLLLDNMTNFEIFATTLDTNTYLENIHHRPEKFAIILGNEANGVEQDILNKVSNPIKINMQGQAESLNVAVSGSILMHYFKNILK